MEEGHSTPRASRNLLPAHSVLAGRAPSPFVAPALDSRQPSGSSNLTPIHTGNLDRRRAAPLHNHHEASHSDGHGRATREELLARSARHEKHTKGYITSETPRNVLQIGDPRVREDILRLIDQWLGDEGYTATKLVLSDETNLKHRERDEKAHDVKKLTRAILNGEWAEVDSVVSKPLVRTQKALLYALYRQQFLEHIEYRELQKAFTLLNKRLKPLEHFQPTPSEFRDLCYLLSAKSVHDAPSFKNWEGVQAGREKLVEAFGRMVEAEQDDNDDTVIVPPNRLMTLFEQAVAHQIEQCRYRPKDPTPLTSLLHDYAPFIVPNRLAQVYRGHNANIKAAQFAGDDGRFVVTGSSDNTVRMWEMGGSCLSVLRGHTSRIWDVDATSTGEFIASASGDKTVRVWRWRHDDDHDIQECRQVLKGNNGDVYAARWHPLGNHVVSAGYDRIVRLFDVEGGNIIKTFTGHALSISSIVFNPLGNLIISGSKDSSVRFWDSVSGLCIRTLNAQLGEVTSVDSDGHYLLTNSRDNAIRLWDVRMLRPLRRFKAHANTSQNFIRATFMHSSLLISGSEDGRLYMWDRESSDVLQTLDGHEGVVYGAVWNDRQSLLASYGSEPVLRTWDFKE